MNALLDLLPVVLFGIAYFLRGIYTATAVLIVACFALVLVSSVPRVLLIIIGAAVTTGLVQFATVHTGILSPTKWLPIRATANSR